MVKMKNADAIIIGSGQAGNPLALKLAEAGWKTLLIEKSAEQIGGTCVNVGCTPSKTLIGSAKVAQQIRTADKHGLSTGGELYIDFQQTQKRKNDLVLTSREGWEERFNKAKNIELVFGTASFIDSKTISIKTPEGKKESISAKHIFINSGSRPMIPDIAGLDEVTYYDSTAILALETIPESLVVLGGSYIGLELGQMFSRFGSAVTIIEQSPQLMPKEDQDIAAAMQELLEKEGLKVYVNAKTKRVSAQDNNTTVTIEQGEDTLAITGSHLLIATGRTPNSDGLNVHAAGIATDEKGFIKVNDRLETNMAGIYALGDINGGAAFTHVAYNDYMVVYKNLLKKEQHSTKNRLTPYCMFTDPQLARVGLSEAQAREKDFDIEVVKIPGTRITRGLEIGSKEGLWKAVIDKKSGLILGAAIIGSEGGEVMTVLQMAMLGGIKAVDIRDGMFAHPTFAESLNTLFMEMK